MRVLQVIWMVVGLSPGLGEVAETAVHLATSGHLAHSDADRGDLGSQGDEHGCGTTQHHCDCCASQVVAAAGSSDVIARPVITPGQPAAPAVLITLAEPAPPFRPPILS